MYFRSYRLSNTWLNHSLESSFPEPPSTINVLMGTEQLSNLQESTFIIFFHPSEEKWFAKVLPYWNLKSYWRSVTHWLPATSILFGIMIICSSLFKCKYLEKKTFSHFFVQFMESPSNFKYFRKQDDRDSQCISEITDSQSLVRPLSRKLRFKTSFDSQRVNGYETIVKAAWQNSYQFFLSLWREMTWNISPLLKLEILGVFVNTLTADDRYPKRDCENLQLSIQMQISLKKSFFWNFCSIYGIFIKF